MVESLRILIIDDDLLDRLAITRALRSSGMRVEVSEAGSIEAAWERIGDGVWDCVFLDYLLPGGDGLELLTQFRAESYEMPIVIVTSQGDEKVAVEVMKQGGSDYITKNLLSSEAVSTVVRRAVRTHKAEEERRLTALALADSEARLAEAQRIANIGSWEMDAATLEEFWTDQVFAILGEPSRGNCKMGRRTLKHHILPEDVGLCTQAYQDIISRLVPRKIDVRIRDKEGRIIEVELQGKPMIGPDGKLVKLIGTIQDISTRKEIELALRQAKELAERNAKAKEEFLANMSHEIRTPMNAILGFAKLLQDSPLDAQQQDYLQAIDTSGEALLAIINDILDLSKIEAGMMRFEAAPFSVKAILLAMKDIFAAKVQEKNIDFTAMVGPGVPDLLLGDEIKLKQVLLNLISNALKFTEEGEVNLEVKVLSQSGKVVRLLFEVADTGIGISGDKQQTIFESFTQASSDTTRKYGGTGLGLTICKRIVELQGGRIGLQSAPGEGSTFFFDLSFEVADPKPTMEAAPTQGELRAPSGPPIKVLVAEDNKVNQRLATIILEKMGFVCLLAATGLEAIQLLIAERPDIVLMDIQMPEMDGYEAARQIRSLADPDLRSVPIVALTAHALREEIAKTRAAGMDAFLSKPFQALQLQETILRLTQRAGVSPSPSSLAQNVLESPESGILDLRALEEMTEGNAAFKQELIDIFLQEVPKAMDKMQAALDRGAGVALHQAAHAIKPSLLLFGVPEARVLLQILEAADVQPAIGPEHHDAFARLLAHAQAACARLQA